MGVGGACCGAPQCLLAAELWAPPLLLCWLCCWPDDTSDSSSSSKHPRKPVIASAGAARPRAGEPLARRGGSSAPSLHSPTTSGHTKQPLSAHRSHEEIGRRKSHLECREEEARYHSAPSVIDEVVHRRDWERCCPPRAPAGPAAARRAEPPPREPHSNSSEESFRSDEQIVGKPCKKHYTNIKSSRGKGDGRDKELTDDDVKDRDSTENGVSNSVSNFYIGELEDEACLLIKDKSEKCTTDTMKPEENTTVASCKVKETKQVLNESIRSKDRSKKPLVPVQENQVSRVFEAPAEAAAADRSGAQHHEYARAAPYPPHSVEPVGYESGACYLAEEDCVSELRSRVGVAGAVGAAGVVGAAGAAGRGVRARHASDGDILAPAPRPESGAFSESDLDLDLELELKEREERPPAYSELRQCAAPDRKETAI